MDKIYEALERALGALCEASDELDKRKEWEAEYDYDSDCHQTVTVMGDGVQEAANKIEGVMQSIESEVRAGRMA